MKEIFDRLNEKDRMIIKVIFIAAMGIPLASILIGAAVWGLCALVGFTGVGRNLLTGTSIIGSAFGLITGVVGLCSAIDEAD
jgi:hypothetical protein